MTPIAKYGFAAPAATRSRSDGMPRGNGYVGGGAARSALSRGPLNGILGGIGNVICLDVLRSLLKEPASLEALQAENPVSPASACASKLHDFRAARGRRDGGGQARRSWNPSLSRCRPASWSVMRRRTPRGFMRVPPRR